MPRFLEGEPLLYNGWIWIVKGIEHPDGYVVAYPRYCIECIPPRKLYRAEYLRKINYYKWNCVDLDVPVIPRDKVYLIYPRPWRVTQEFISLLCELSGIECSDIILTGSLVIGLDPLTSDTDLVVYGRENVDRVYEALVYLRESGATSPLGMHGSLIEYKKHGDLLFEDYMLLRRYSVLQGFYKNKYRYTIRLVPYDHGFSGCTDPVIWSSMVRLKIVILEEISPYTTPAIYRVGLLDRVLRTDTAIMLSYRIRYTELRKGTILQGLFRIEKRLKSKNYYLIPDHGSQRILGISSRS